MANGVIIPQQQHKIIKAKYFSGTTDSGANILLNYDTQVVVIGCLIEQGYMGIPFIYNADNGRYLKIKDASDYAKPNTAVSGYYYYVVASDMELVS